MRDSCTWVTAGTKTYRMGSRKILGLYGGNLQNIEKSMREIYVPDDGKILVQTDQSGADAVIVAYDCEPGDYRALFQNGVKPHVYVALQLFDYIWAKKMRENNLLGAEPFDIKEIIKTPIHKLKSLHYWKNLDLLIKDSDNWPVDQRFYYLAKQTCHSANYDIQANTFRMNILEKSGGKIVVSQDEAERFLLVYRALFPEIPERNRRVARQAQATRTLYNMFGHPYHISQYQFSENNLKEYYSWNPQSTVGQITNIAITDMQNFIEKNKLDWDILINCHDSMTTQCPINEMLDCAKMQKQFIEQEFTSTIDGVPFRMRSETMAGFNGAPRKEKEINGVKTIINPMGLQEVKI